MTTVRESKPKVERDTRLKRDFLARHTAIYEGWLTEQRASVVKPKLSGSSAGGSKSSKKSK